jgi:sugar lactone lactonase YvrE
VTSEEAATPEVQTLLTGIAFGESPRWHDDRLWFSDWGAQQVVAVDLEGNSEVIAQVSFPSFPMCIDWLPDGRLLIVSAREGRLLRREPDGSLVPHADLSGLAGPGHPWNEIVVDGRGNVYVNNQGFEFQVASSPPERSPSSPPTGRLARWPRASASPMGWP